MTEKEIKIRKLQTFKKRKHDLDAFIDVDIVAFQEYVNECIDELIPAVEKDYPAPLLKSILKKYLPAIRQMNIGETVEREYVAEELYELSQIVGVNISFSLNRIIYGFTLALLLQCSLRSEHNRRGELKEQDGEIRKQEETICCGCGYVMITEIIFPQEPAEDDEYDTFCGRVVVECPVCGEYNLFYLKENGQAFVRGDYRVVENLDEYDSEEAAKQRYEQIKYWRKR